MRSDENEDEEEPAPLNVEALATDATMGTLSGSTPDDDVQLKGDSTQPEKVRHDGGGFSGKSQIMTLMTTDVRSDKAAHHDTFIKLVMIQFQQVDHVADFSWHLFSLIDAPIEIVVGTYYLYHLLG